MFDKVHEILTMKPLYQFVHYIIKFVFALLVYVPYYFKLTKQKFVQREPDNEDIKKDVETLKNLPRHISFVTLEHDVDLVTLAKLVVWSVATGIPYISVFDKKGVLLAQKAEFYQEICTIRDKLLGQHYEIHLSNDDCSQTNGHLQQGGAIARKAYLYILTNSDGKASIVNAARDFCSKISKEECDLNLMNVDYFSKLLKSNTFPDPDLALKFSLQDILDGLLPWQIRLTEFISFPSLRIMDYGLFLNSLRRYSKCEQRLGR